jgi:hypothetical protein
VALSRYCVVLCENQVGNMEKYYYLSWKGGNGPLASAFAPKDAKSDNELIKELNGSNQLPFELSLVNISVGKNGLIKSEDLTGIKEVWMDYQPSNLAWPIMSDRLKSIVESNLTGNENLDWVTCKIKSDKEERRYYIPRFNKMLDVLDMQKTLFVKDTNHVIRPVFALSKINAYSIFHAPANFDLWKITSGLYVSEKMKKAIQKQKLTGMVFEKVSVA